MRMIAIAKAGLGHINNTANTFGDILSCHFEMHATRIGANLIMRVKKAGNFGHHIINTACLIAAAGLDGIAMHRITAPYNIRPMRLDRPQKWRQTASHLFRAHPNNQSQPACLIARVQDINQAQQLVRIKAWPAFQANRIGNTTHIFNMRTIRLACAIANPQHMRRCVVPSLLVCDGITARHGLFKPEKKRLMASVKLSFGKRAHRCRCHPTSLHKIQAFFDPFSKRFKTLCLRRVFQKISHPAMHLGQIGKPTLRKRTKQIQS